MQTMAWTDERLEERFDSIDRRFDEVGRRFDEFDRKFDHRFDRVERQAEFTRNELKAEIGLLQSGINRIWISLVAGLFGVIAAILAKGV
jgi:tetrahydromethanopterin S-methyltransferase subunit G